MRKSQSTYEAFNVLSEQPSPASAALKRYSSTEAIRNGTLAGSHGDILAPSLSRLTAPTPISPRLHMMEGNAELLVSEIGYGIRLQRYDNGFPNTLTACSDVPLTTEELAVLVAINPENELLYRNTGSARQDNVSTVNGGGEDGLEDASTWDVDSNNNNTTGEPDAEVGWNICDISVMFSFIRVRHEHTINSFVVHVHLNIDTHVDIELPLQKSGKSKQFCRRTHSSTFKLHSE